MNKFISLHLRLFFSFLLFIGSLLGMTSTFADSVHEYLLSNGLKLLVKEDHRAPVVVTQVWYKIGGSYEPDGITGISHALEHMMFEGSKNYPEGEFSRVIAANGGDENAETSADYTFYYQELAADRLPIAFKLEADRMQFLNLTSEAFKKEIEVVKEERRLRTENNPQGLSYERFNAAAYVANPYHRPVVGWMNDLQNLTIQDVRKWYEQWYAPNNAIIVVVGDVNSQNVYELAQHYFGSIPVRQLPVVKPFHEVPQISTRDLIVKTPARLPWLIMGFNTPSLKSAKIKWHPYALDVAAAILAEGNSARLVKDLVRDKQLASEINANYTLLDRLPNLFTFDGTPSPGHTVTELKEAIQNEIKQLQTTMVSTEELQQVKNRITAQKIYQKDSLTAQATEIGKAESIGLSWQATEEYINEIQKITPQQIQFVAKKYFIPTRMTVAQLLPLPLKTPVNDEPISRGPSNVR